MFSRIYKIFLIFSISILLSRIFYLQVLKGDFFYNISVNNYLRVLPLSGYRGNILDRYGRELAVNKLKFAVQILPDKVKNKDKIFKIISREFNVSYKTVEKNYRRKFRAVFFPVTLVKNINLKKALIFKEKYRNISGLIVREDIERYYPEGKLCCGVLGYLGEISQAELVHLKRYGYRYSSSIGKSGVEKSLEPYLKGSAGGMLVKINNKGKIVKLLGEEKPQRGLDVYLTLDLDLEKKAYQILGNRKGCFLVLDVKTGEVLVSVSSPGFDPNIFVNQGRNGLAALLDSESKPLLNRAIQAQYPLGSIFKLVVTIAGLETGKLKPQTQFFCPGYFKFGGRKYKCWKKEGHGWQNLEEGIVHSCNVYFYQAGLKTGVKNIVHYGKILGFGRKTGIDLPYESSGLLPNPEWKLKTKKEAWYPGDTINLSVGQGYLLVTPIQVLRFIAAIANGGYLLKPLIVKSISGEEVRKQSFKKINLHKKTLQLVRRAMKGVVNDFTGTGQYARLDNVIVAAKTATAQVPKGASQAWFVGFAPYKNPQIAFLVTVEHGGGGGFVTARLAKEFLEYYFKKTGKNENKN